jgi:NitT/TauT family transport system substrate-binding protein
MQSDSSKRCWIWLLVLGLLITGCSEQSNETDAVTMDEVTFNMGWLPQGSSSGVIVAMGLGFFEDVGINVEAARGFGSIRTVNEVDQGMFDFANTDLVAVVLNRSNGGRTRLIGAINGRWPGGLCFVKERHQILEPADLTGLKVGGGPLSPMQVMVPVWLERNGLPGDSVTLMQLDPAIVVGALLEETIDVSECWLGASIPIFQKRAAEAGLTIGWLEYANFNFDIYGNGLVTSDRLIADNPDLVQRFVEASFRGYDYVVEHTEEAAAIIVGLHPVLDEGIVLQQLQETIASMNDHKNVSWLEEDKIARTLEILRSAYDIDAAVGVNDIYTTAFLEHKSGPRAEE